jgi:hypothetical protein
MPHVAWWLTARVAIVELVRLQQRSGACQREIAAAVVRTTRSSSLDTDKHARPWLLALRFPQLRGHQRVRRAEFDDLESNRYPCSPPELQQRLRRGGEQLNSQL